jgi:hypothetical protein
MGLTLSHQSALDVLRALRAKGTKIQEMDVTRFDVPRPWRGERWSMRNFGPKDWKLPIPSERNPLNVIVPSDEGRVRLRGVHTHVMRQDLPPRSILWVDEHAAMVRPELMYLQMAESLSMPALVMLGYELCGHFGRDPWDPLNGSVAMHIDAAASVESISEYAAHCKRLRGLKRAREALTYVSDHALSVPEVVIATMYSLPPHQSGYGLGPVTLNKRIVVPNPNGQDDGDEPERVRFPDVLLGIAPVGINYDGEDHLDLQGLVDIVQKAALADGDAQPAMREALEQKMAQVRAKVVDDNLRDRQLAARGYLVLPATKEDLFEEKKFDAFTRHLLGCVKNIFGIDTSSMLRALDDTNKTADRNNLLSSLLPCGGYGKPSHGIL